MTTAPELSTQAVQTVPLRDAGDLLGRLPADAAVAWVRGGDGLVGWGEAARVELEGPDRFAAATRWWRELSGTLQVHDDVRRPGTGPVAFGSFGFADTDRSVLVVPRVVVGRRGGHAWVTTVGPVSATPAPLPAQPPVGVRLSADPAAERDWQRAVARATARIRGGELDKVVLAMPADALAEAPVDPRWLLARLAARYPDCWTFHVDGLLGATPELLVRRTGRSVTSRVLAGTIRRGETPAEDDRLARQLATSTKDRAEHELAVTAVRRALGERCRAIDVPGEPAVLGLANVFHLATDIEGRLAEDTDALSLAAALHPTPAVAGVPRPAALRLIAELEPAARGRYAGPVGWVDGHGDGEWGIALRCAELDGARLRLFAGCGIVAGSTPDAELAEWRTKLTPIREALSG